MLHSVNLFPWREARRAAHRRRFLQLIALSVLLSGIGLWGAGLFLEKQKQNQHARLGYLNQYDQQLDQQLRALRGVEKEYQALLARLEVVEALQQQRNKTTKLMHLMTERIPEGVYVDKIMMKGREVEISGISDSTAHLASMLDQLEKTTEISALTMHSIVAGTKRFNQDFQSFKVSFEFNPFDDSTAAITQGGRHHG